MIFGWLEEGVTDRWILVDPHFPWPALHNGRNAIRKWADAQNRFRIVHQTAGPRRCPWPCKTAVKETGNADLRVWPCELYGQPRKWTLEDRVWRQPMVELSEIVASDIGCPVELVWMGGDRIERAVSPPGLRNMGFLCWGKGQREPKKLKEPRKGLNIRVRGKDLRVMSQGQDAWTGGM